jgi:hypothetical protein
MLRPFKSYYHYVLHFIGEVLKNIDLFCWYERIKWSWSEDRVCPSVCKVLLNHLPYSNREPPGSKHCRYMKLLCTDKVEYFSLYENQSRAAQSVTSQ